MQAITRLDVVPIDDFDLDVLRHCRFKNLSYTTAYVYKNLLHINWILPEMRTLSSNHCLTIEVFDRNHSGMKRHDYVVHYATQNPFEQYIYRARLNASERRKLERQFQRGLKDWTVHSYRIEEAKMPTAALSTLLEELDDLRSGSK